MKENNVQVLTRTAVLVALALVFQNLRMFLGTSIYSQFIIGSLVNAVLIVAVGAVNVYSGIVVSVIAPIVAYLQGHLPLPIMIPVVAIGNALIVVVYHLVQKYNKYVGVISGSIVKALFLYLGVQMVLKIVKGTIPDAQFTKMSAALSASFSWPQLVTALIGGFIALLVLRMLNRAMD
ncbi:MAG: ECF transporter S component [Clostridiaceae bacterium]|nr:ECF transporter S component [Clostridiaceae bacterium]